MHEDFPDASQTFLLWAHGPGGWIKAINFDCFIFYLQVALRVIEGEVFRLVRQLFYFGEDINTIIVPTVDDHVNVVRNA